MKGPELLSYYQDNWETEMGAWFPGERVVLRGKDIFEQLSEMGWFEYFIFGVTGKTFKTSKTFVKLVEGMWATTSFPDVRLWNNRVCALAGTSRSTGALALASGLAVSEATVYGLKPIKGAMDFFLRLKAAIDQGDTLESVVMREVKKYRGVCGYGRPLVDKDERIEPILDFTRRAGAKEGEYLKLAFEVETFFKSTRYKYRLNAAGLDGAIMADMGLTLENYYYLSILCFVAGMLPCFLDTLSKPEGAFFPLAVERLNYTGEHATRRWDN